jgi:hypothetical protein
VKSLLTSILILSTLLTEAKVVIKGKIHHYDGKFIIITNARLRVFFLLTGKSFNPVREGIF